MTDHSATDASGYCGGDDDQALAADKDALRALRRARRRSAPLDPGRGLRLAEAVLSRPRVAARVTPAAVVTCYVSLPWEPPTADLRERLRAAGCHLYLPVARAERQLTWVPDPGPTAAAWGVPGQDPDPGTGASELSSAEVAALGLALVCVPALAATAEGARLGQGGGYYDTFLAQLPRVADGGPLRMVVVGPDEVLESLPVAAHDEPFDELVIA